MLERLRQYLYKVSLKLKGINLRYPIRGRNFLFGNAKGLNNGAFIMIESSVKLNIVDDAVLNIADYVYINSYSIIDCHKRIDIGKRVQIGPYCYIADFDHDINVDVRKPHHRLNKIYKPVIIEDNVWIGAGVIILKGVTIGRNSVIAAGSVVVKSIPANVVAGGTPASVIKLLQGNIDEEAMQQENNF